MKQLLLFAPPSDSSHPKATIHWRIYVDGAARNNPGPAGAGVVVYKNNTLFEKHGFYLGSRTNNQAEYAALLLALYLVQKKYKQGDHLDIISDSQLLVKQFSGEYRIKHPELKPMHLLAKKLLSGTIYTIAHVLREKNQEADELANSGIDSKTKLPKEFLELLNANDISW